MSRGIDISCQVVKTTKNGLIWLGFSVKFGFFGAGSR